MNIKEVIQTQPFGGSVVLAGKDALDNEFLWCTPDIAVDTKSKAWVLPCLFVIYIGRPDEMSWEEYFERLVNEQASAVLFIGSDYDKIGLTKEAIEYCDNNSLPLVWLPRNVAVSRFVSHIFPLLSGVELTEYFQEMWLKELCHTEWECDEIFASTYGYNRKYNYLCSLIVFEPQKREYGFASERYITATHALMLSHFGMEDAKPISFCELNTLVTFIPFPKGLKKAEIKKLMRNTSAEVKALCEDRYRRRMNVGTLATSLKGFRESYNRAFKTHKIVERLGVNEQVFFYDDWQLHMMLLDRPDAELRDFMERILNPVINDATLMDTLTMYLICGEKLRATAAKLYVHISTLHYRIGRISELLGCDLADTTTRFRLRMAITIYRYLQGEEKEDK